MSKLQKKFDDLLEITAYGKEKRKYVFGIIHLAGVLRKSFSFRSVQDSSEFFNNDIKTKVGISNYKPFGSNMQYFSKKPITLVYGPNSIGKSSLIKSLLYFRAIRVNGNQNLKTTDIFGDDVDFGGFYNAVHKHNTDKNITFLVDNDKGSEVLVNLFGYVSKDLYNYILLKNVNFEINEETILIFKLYIAFFLHSKNKDLMFHKVNKDKNNNPALEKDAKGFIDIGFLIINFLEKYSYEHRDELTDDDNVNFDAIEKISTKEFNNIANVVMNILQKYRKEKFPNPLFDIASEKQRKFTAEYTISSDGISIEYNIDGENLLDLEINDKFDLLSFAEDLKHNNSYVTKFLFHKHQLFERLFSVEKYSNFFTQMDIHEYVESLGHFYWDKDGDSVLEKWKDSISSFESRIAHCPFYPKKDNYNRPLFSGLKNISDRIKQTTFILNKIIWAMEMHVGENKYRYLGPLRHYPDRYFDLNNEESEGNNSSRDSWAKLLNGDRINDEINKWLGSDKLKTPYKIEVQKIYDNNMILSQLDNDNKYTKDELDNIIKKIKPIREILAFRDMKKNTIVSHKDMGLGISQVLPILVNLFDFENKKTLVIEQPELHLHPAIQSELADEFIKSKKEIGDAFTFTPGRSSSDIIIETHSEHILLRLMKRMRQTSEGILEDKSLKLTPDDVCLLYVDSDGDSTFILELELDEDGSLLDPWPGGFFEEGFNERFL